MEPTPNQFSLYSHRDYQSRSILELFEESERITARVQACLDLLPKDKSTDIDKMIREILADWESES